MTCELAFLLRAIIPHVTLHRIELTSWQRKHYVTLCSIGSIMLEQEFKGQLSHRRCNADRDTTKSENDLATRVTRISDNVASRHFRLSEKKRVCPSLA